MRIIESKFEYVTRCSHCLTKVAIVATDLRRNKNCIVTGGEFFWQCPIEACRDHAKHGGINILYGRDCAEPFQATLPGNRPEHAA